MSANADLSRAFHAIIQHADRLWPGHGDIVVVVKLNDTTSAYLPVVPRAAGVEGDERLSTMEKCVVDALRRLRPGDTLTGDELATKAGYSNTGRFRDCLASLVRRGTIQNKRPGYRL